MASIGASTAAIQATPINQMVLVRRTDDDIKGLRR
jgi:hypothetical protein